MQAVFLLVSILLHALLAAWLASHDDGAKLADSRKHDVEIVELSKEDFERIRSQIVETARARKTQVAPLDAYLGERTQAVDRQTRARESAPFRDGRKGGARGEDRRVSLDHLGVAMNLKPLGHLGPGDTAATSDHLREVKPGAQTLLNTKEFAYFSYYQRVRQQLEQYWEPGLRKKLRAMFDRGRQLASDREHATRVLVVMNDEGVITKILIESTSGLLDLDQAAVEAFNKAGPFPNPPKGMIEKDGTVKVEWEFVLKT